MRLFKSLLKDDNYIEECEKSFIQNFHDMIHANISGLAEVDFALQNKGLSLQKLLEKNNINSIVIEFKGRSYSYTYKFGFADNIELIDIISLCDLIAKFSYETKENFYITWRGYGNHGQDYNTLINDLFLHDLNGIYAIEKNRVIEQEGGVKVVNEKINDSGKELLLDYYNPLTSHSGKKEALSNISNIVEPLKSKLPKDKSKIYDKSLINAINSFMEIVNTIDGIRHSNNKTQSLSIEQEVELMDIAVNHAITLLKYNGEK